MRVRNNCGIPGRTCLDVEDTGIGIPTEMQAGIFEPFVQVDTDNRKEGSGLGLAISRDLARGMGADLVLRSEPGQGSVFTVILPAANQALSDKP